MIKSIIFLLLIIISVTYVNSAATQVKILSANQLQYTQTNTEEKDHQTIEDVFNDQIYFFQTMKRFDAKGKYDFDSRWFLPSIIIVDLGSRYFSLDERRFLLHDTHILEGSLWVNRTNYQERTLFNYNAQIRQELKQRKLSGLETGKQIFRKYVINPLLHKGRKFHIEIIIDLISEYPLVVNYLGGYVTESLNVFQETVYTDRCAHFLICDQNETTYYPEFKTYLRDNLGYDDLETNDIENKIQASLTYTFQGIQEALHLKFKGKLSEKLSKRNMRVKFMGALQCFIILNKLQEAYIYTCKVVKYLPEEWKVKLMENRRERKIRKDILIDENRRFNYLQIFNGFEFKRTFLMEKFRAKVAFVLPSEYNVYRSNYFEARKDTWILLKDQKSDKFTLQDVYESDIIIAPPEFTPDPSLFRHGLCLINHLDNSQTMSSFSNLILVFREFDKLEKYPFNSTFFTPVTYVFNLQTHEFSDDEHEILNLPESGVWLLRSDNGKYIRLLHDIKELKNQIKEHKGELLNSDLILRQYVVQPLLIKQRAFILRTYAFIISSYPFILVSQIGYLRFCEEKFDIFSQKPFSNIVGNTPDIKDDDFMKNDDFIAYLLKAENDFGPERVERMRKDIALAITYILESVFDGLDHRENQMENLRFDFKIDENLSPYLMNVEVDSNTDTPNKNVYNFIQEIENQFLDMVLYSHDMNEQRKETDAVVIKQICPDCTILINESTDYNILKNVKPGEFQSNQNIQNNRDLVFPKGFKAGSLELKKEIRSSDL